MVEDIKKTVFSALEEEKEEARRATGFSSSSSGADGLTGMGIGLRICRGLEKPRQSRVVGAVVGYLR